MPADLPAGVQQLTPLSTVQSVFACWFGSLRYKLATNANRMADSSLTATFAPLPLPDALSAPYGGSGCPIQRTNLAQNNALEVEFPCYTPYNLLLSEETRVGHSPVDEVGLLSVLLTGTTNVSIDFYQAAGDDYRPFYLISPPADYPQSATLHYTAPLR